MKAIKELVKILALVALGIFTSLSIFSALGDGEPRKSGTDAAGYAILAQQIRNNESAGTYSGNHATRIATRVALKSKIDASQWETGLAPNSFTYSKEQGRILTQYPIGTSTILSAFPPSLEVRLLMACTAWGLLFYFFLFATQSTRHGINVYELFSSALITVLALWALRAYISLSYSMFPTGLISATLGVASASLFSTDFKHSTRYYILIACGCLAGCSVFIRISNILILLPLALTIIFSNAGIRKSNSKKDLRSHFRRTAYKGASIIGKDFTLLGCGFISGAAPFAIISFKIFGNALFSSYPSYDKQITDSAFSVYGNLESIFLRSGIHSTLAIASLFAILSAYKHLSNRRHLCYGMGMLTVFVVISLLICIKVVVAPYYLDFISIFYLFHIQGLRLAKSLSLQAITKSNRLLFTSISASLLVMLLVLFNSLHSTGKIGSNAASVSQLRPSLGQQAIEDLRSNALWTHEEGGYLYYHYKIPSLRHSRIRDRDLAREIAIKLKSHDIKQYMEGDAKNFELLNISDLARISSSAHYLDHVEVREIEWKESD